MNELKARLQMAIQTGEILGIIYHGGSQPGAWREISPQELKGDRLSAWCHQSKAVKSFFLSRLELREVNASVASNGPEWNNELDPPAEFEDCQAAYAELEATLIDLRFQVDFRTTEYGQYLELRTAFKNGRPKKNPTLVLSFETVSWDYVLEGDGTVRKLPGGPREKCWGVQGVGGRSLGSYKYSAKAIEKFLNVAMSLQK